MMMVVGLSMCLSSTANPDKKLAFNVKGTFVEGCSCHAPCACQLTGLEMGCLGVGVMNLTSGSYAGASLAGAKIAYAAAPGEWVRLYIDAKTPGQRKAAEAFGRAVYNAFGPIEAVKNAKIGLAGSNGKYMATVDGGAIMSLTTTPVFGGDKKTPLTYANINDPIHPTVMQGKTVRGSFKDGDRDFTLSDSNSYFAKINKKGKI